MPGKATLGRGWKCERVRRREWGSRWPFSPHTLQLPASAGAMSWFGKGAGLRACTAPGGAQGGPRTPAGAQSWGQVSSPPAASAASCHLEAILLTLKQALCVVSAPWVHPPLRGRPAVQGEKETATWERAGRVRERARPVHLRGPPSLLQGKLPVYWVFVSPVDTTCSPRSSPPHTQRRRGNRNHPHETGMACFMTTAGFLF